MEKTIQNFVRSQSSINTQNRSFKNIKRTKTPLAGIVNGKEYLKVYNASKALIGKKTIKAAKNNFLVRSAKKVEPKFTINIEKFKFQDEAPRTDRSFWISKQKLEEVKKNSEKGVNRNLVNYQIMKAKSDFLELKRDLALYEDNFSKDYGVEKVIRKLEAQGETLRKKSTRNEKNNWKELEKPISDFLSKDWLPNYGKSTQRSVYIENFSVRPVKPTKTTEKFSGVREVCGVKCLLTVASQAKQVHFITCLINSSPISLSFHKDLSHTSYGTFSDFIDKIILPNLLYRTSTNSLSFLEPLKGEKFTVLSIKGFGLTTIHLTRTKHDLTIQILQNKATTTITPSQFGIPETFKKSLFTTQFSELKSLLKTHLFFTFPILSFHNSHFFEFKEINSQFLNEEFLENAFENYLKKIFKFRIRVKGRTFKITGYTNYELCVSSNNKKLMICEGSKEFAFLTGLQSKSLLKSMSTLKSSLELESFLVNIFKSN